MKIVLGIVVGLVVGFLVISGIEYVIHFMLYPPPPGTDIRDPADLERILAAMPTAAMALVALAWFLGTLAGAWVANRISGRAVAGWTIAAVAILGGVYSMVTATHPAWMWVSGIGLPLIAGWLAQRMAKVPA